MTHNQSGGISYNDQAIHIGDNHLKNVYVKHEPLPEIDLTSAIALLQAMPTKLVPESKPADLPAWSRFSQLQQSYFIGRDQELMQLARTLKHGNTCLITTGIGGIGKSSLASEFVLRYGSYFAGGVFWLSFADPQNIANEIAECGVRLRLFHEQEDLTLEQRVGRVKNEWQKPLPRLLIFDNCDQLSAAQCRSFLAQYLPSVGGCRVLITSRNSLWPQDTKLSRIALGVLKLAESIALLQSYRGNLSNDDAQAIAEELGNLPLALSLAGRFLSKYAKTSFGIPRKYLEQIQANKFNNRFLATVDEGERSVYATFDLSFQRLQAEEPVDAQAIALLSRASYFAPNQPIPSALLFRSLDPTTEEQDAETEFLRTDALQRLLELGLLKASAENNLHIHRLISEFSQTQQTLQNEQAQERVEQVVVDKTLGLVNDKIPSRLQIIVPHLSHCYRAIEQQNTLRNAALALALGRTEHEQNNYHQAEPLLERALRINETALGTEHPTTASSLNNLAALYYAQGRYGEAEPLSLRALRIREQTLGSEHPDTANSLNNLATLYDEQGRYTESEPLYLRALRIDEQALGAEHPRTANSLNNLAALYKAQGRYREAEPLHLRALRIREQALGAEHPTTATSLNNLAYLYDAQGRYGEVEPLYLRALRIREQALGAEPPDTATSLNNLAYLYNAQGRYAEAEPLYLRALRILEQALGAEHPDTAQSMNNLATQYDTQGRYAEAEPLYLRALRIREQALGAEHPDTASSLNNLASLYESQGRYAEAEPPYLRSLRILEQVLGAEHPTTATSLNNLAELYRTQGRYTEAEPLYLRALRILEQSLGAEHPSTAQSLNNLALLYQSQGRYAEAEPLSLRALRIREQALGTEHPSIATSLNNLANLYNAQGLYAEAEQLYQRALRIREQTLGTEHPNTQNTRRGLEFTQQSMNLIHQAQSDVQQALDNPSIDREELTQKLEEAAVYFAKGQEAGSPLYVLAEQLRALAAQLRND